MTYFASSISDALPLSASNPFSPSSTPLRSRFSRMSTAVKAATKRPISGLQREVLSLYKRALKMTSTKPESAQPSFLLLTRYNFRHPPLTSRDVAAIEHQIRLGTRTLEMYSSPSIRKVNTTDAMQRWWEAEVKKGRAFKPASASV